MSLKFLDIIAKCLYTEKGIDVLRYDGSVSSAKRQATEKAFIECEPHTPLLVTAGTGGVGLNITAASVVVQLEPWWNRNTERQTVGRSHHQGQTNIVKYFRLEDRNSAMDAEILHTQQQKTNVNEKLMRPLVRRHDEGPVVTDLMGHISLQWKLMS